jgi:hypothetical protein
MRVGLVTVKFSARTITAPRRHCELRVVNGFVYGRIVAAIVPLRLQRQPVTKGDLQNAQNSQQHIPKPQLVH